MYREWKKIEFPKGYYILIWEDGRIVGGEG